MKYEDALKKAKEKGIENPASCMLRITYRSVDRTLSKKEVNEIHKRIEEEMEKQFGVCIR